VDGRHEARSDVEKGRSAMKTTRYQLHMDSKSMQKILPIIVGVIMTTRSQMDLDLDEKQFVSERGDPSTAVSTLGNRIT